MRGILAFYEMVKAEDHADLVDQMEYYLIQNCGLIELALAWENQELRRERFPMEEDRMEAGRERLSFSGDTEDEPPLAWIMYWRGRYSNTYAGASVDNSLQEWGYVFWDRRRLVRSKGREEVLRLREHASGGHRWS